jgi:uncharacterized protein (TIGR02444 family)
MKAWDFAVETYRREDVAVAALALQNRHRQCVSLLLWRLWAAMEGRPIDGDLLMRAVAAAKSLEAEVLGPSRRIRAALKTTRPPLEDGPRLAARAAYMTGELAAERALIEALETMTPEGRGAAEDRLAALAEATRAWGAIAPTRLLATFASDC